MLKGALKSSFYSDEIYEFHEYANIFPFMNSKEIKKLGESIKEFGQEEDIVLYEGKILDGRHTYLACRREDITPRFRYYTSKLDPLDYVRVRNLHRRHMSAAQSAAVALVFIQIERKRARERIVRTQFNNHKEKITKKDTASDPGLLAVKGRAIDIVAKEHNIAPKTLIKAEKIEKASQTDPEIKEKWEKAKKNQISLEEVYRAVKYKSESKIKKEIVNKFKESGQKLFKKETTLKIQEIENPILGEGEIRQEDKCQFCSKATVFAITCEACGHRTARVLCDNDFINSNKRLLNPNLKKCANSSD